MPMISLISFGKNASIVFLSLAQPRVLGDDKVGYAYNHLSPYSTLDVMVQSIACCELRFRCPTFGE